MMKKAGIKAETLPYGFSSESTQGELSNAYQHDRVKMVFKKSLCPLRPLKERSPGIGGVTDNFVMNYEFSKYLKENCFIFRRYHQKIQDIFACCKNK